MAKRRTTDEADKPQMMQSAVRRVEDYERQPAVAELPPAKPPSNGRAGDGSDSIITMSEAARQLGKSPQTIKRWILDGLLNAVSMPTGIFGLRRSELNKFLGGSALPHKEIA